MMKRFALLLWRITAVAAIAYAVLDLTGELDGKYWHPRRYNKYAKMAETYFMQDIPTRDYYRVLSRFSPETDSPEDWYTYHPSTGTYDRVMAHAAQIDSWRPLIARQKAALDDPKNHQDDYQAIMHHTFSVFGSPSNEDLVRVLDYFRSGKGAQDLPTFKEWDQQMQANLRQPLDSDPPRPLPTRDQVNSLIETFWPDRRTK
jgi:hypothetical protein